MAFDRVQQHQRLDLNNTMLMITNSGFLFEHIIIIQDVIFFQEKIKGKIPIEYNLMRLPDSQVTAKTLRTAFYLHGDSCGYKSATNKRKS